MQVETTTIAEIKEEKVDFLTFPYIPLGKLSLITGDPNVGKTHIALAIAAAVTTGEPLPWEPEQSRREPANVIFESMEDGYGDTIKPRLLRLGADCEREGVRQNIPQSQPEIGVGERVKNTLPIMLRKI